MNGRRIVCALVLVLVSMLSFAVYRVATVPMPATVDYVDYMRQVNAAERTRDGAACDELGRELIAYPDGRYSCEDS